MNYCRVCNEPLKRGKFDLTGTCYWCLCHALYVRYGVLAGDAFNAVPYWLHTHLVAWLATRIRYSGEPLHLYRHPRPMYA